MMELMKNKKTQPFENLLVVFCGPPGLEPGRVTCYNPTICQLDTLMGTRIVCLFLLILIVNTIYIFDR